MRIKKDKYTVDSDLAMCPICGEYRMRYYGDDCLICGWEHDEYQFQDHRVIKIANQMSVSQYRRWFDKKREENPNYRWDEDPDKYDRTPLKLDKKSREIKNREIQ